MPKHLTISFGQHSDKGRKEINQDYHGVLVPKEPLLSTKGIAIGLADGISSSNVSQIASQTAVSSFIEDYYCTSEAWSVKKSAHQVLTATNSWLYSQTRKSQYRYDKDRGYVCTFSAMVIKSSTAHVFHAGDTRIYRLQGNTLEQLTNDHRIWASQDKSYLSRALGVQQQLEFDYKTFRIDVGDVFVFATDGVYEFTSDKFIIDAITVHKDKLDRAARLIVDEAYSNGSDDNLTAQIIRVDSLPELNANEILQQFNELPFPPVLEARTTFDGYRIIREIHASSRSHVYLALDIETDTQVVLKTPSVDLQGDANYLERFLLEEWIARRINSPYVLKPVVQTRRRNFLYTVTEYIEGQTLTQWMTDNPKPDLETVRGIVEQIARGLRAFHRLEMLHQDLRPANIMIDNTGTVKIIDFGSTSVAGLMEMAARPGQNSILGTVQYTAPEYFIGDAVNYRADMFSLAVMMYEMLTGKLPYGTQIARIGKKADLRKLHCAPVCTTRPDIPIWVDEAIMKALHPDPNRRYEDLPEFVFDLRHPNKAFLNRTRPPLLERNPVAFWRGVSLVLSIIIAILLYRQ
jgi:serine/threonine protein kinase/serine/threonine protein phosphatase PrpC